MKWQKIQKFFPGNQYFVKGVGTKSKKIAKETKLFAKNEDLVQG